MRDGQVIVTGASRGIGAAVAIELGRRGFTVPVLSRSGGVPAGASPAAYGVVCDVTDEESVRGAVATVAARGPVIGLVNNAGAHVAGAAATLTAADFERTLRLNATSVLVVSREAYAHLVPAGGGLIVNIGSFFDRLGAVESIAYCASKAAVGAITRCLAVEWARNGITVLNVAPGYVETDLNRDLMSTDRMRAWIAKRVPVGRPGTSQEVARLVGVLFAEKIGYLTGETIYIDGGHGVKL